jgi:motility quorum-sensing regulator/GCU-specific mRNA interferase toxin
VEKRKPHYHLADIQHMVADPANRVFTATALDGGLEMGLEEIEMRAVIGRLTTRNLFKSMTTTRDHMIWQDVYHAMTPIGIVAYIKITGYTDGRPPVIQFKRKESAS